MGEGKQCVQRGVTEVDVSGRGAGRTYLMFVVFPRRVMSTLQWSRPETNVSSRPTCCCSVSVLLRSLARKCCSSQVSFMSLARCMQGGARNVPQNLTLHRLSAYSRDLLTPHLWIASPLFHPSFFTTTSSHLLVLPSLLSPCLPLLSPHPFFFTSPFFHFFLLLLSLLSHFSTFFLHCCFFCLLAHLVTTFLSFVHIVLPLVVFDLLQKHQLFSVSTFFTIVNRVYHFVFIQLVYHIPSCLPFFFVTLVRGKKVGCQWLDEMAEGADGPLVSSRLVAMEVARLIRFDTFAAHMHQDNHLNGRVNQERERTTHPCACLVRHQRCVLARAVATR